MDGWFGGTCGTGNPYYLLCGQCRDRYMAHKGLKTTGAQALLVGASPPPLTDVVAPDLLGSSDSPGEGTLL